VLSSVLPVVIAAVCLMVVTCVATVPVLLVSSSLPRMIHVVVGSV
jgi:hypothetical protein